MSLEQTSSSVSLCSSVRLLKSIVLFKKSLSSKLLACFSISFRLDPAVVTCIRTTSSASLWFSALTGFLYFTRSRFTFAVFGSAAVLCSEIKWKTKTVLSLTLLTISFTWVKGTDPCFKISGKSLKHKF